MAAAESRAASAEAKAQRLDQELKRAQEELRHVRAQPAIAPAQVVGPPPPSATVPAPPAPPSAPNGAAQLDGLPADGAAEPPTPGSSGGEGSDEEPAPGPDEPLGAYGTPAPGEPLALGDLPLPEGLEVDSLGVRPSRMNGGRNNYHQFNCHFRFASASLFRKLHGITSSNAIDIIRFGRLDSECCASLRVCVVQGSLRVVPPRQLHTTSCCASLRSACG